MPHALVIGAGSIGKHHIASMLKEALPLNVDVVDSSKESLSKVEAELRPALKPDQSLQCFESLDAVDAKKPDFTILATPSRGRLGLLKTAHDRFGAKTFLLEKLLTPNLKELVEMETFIRGNKIRAWVNCPRRKYEFYQTIQKSLATGAERLVAMEADGGDWRMGSNGIHHMDLFAYLAGSSDLKVCPSRMKLSDRSQKHAGYGELFGELAFEAASGATLRIRNHENPKPMTVGLYTDRSTYLIHEQASEMTKIYFKEKNLFERSPIRLKYQSELTGSYLREVLGGGDPGLTSFEESFKLHQAYFDAVSTLFPGVDFT